MLQSSIQLKNRLPGTHAMDNRISPVSDDIETGIASSKLLIGIPSRHLHAVTFPGQVANMVNHTSNKTDQEKVNTWSSMHFEPFMGRHSHLWMHFEPFTDRHSRLQMLSQRLAKQKNIACPSQEIIHAAVKVIFVNLDESADRCIAMTSHLQNLNIPFARFPATRITHTMNGMFIPSDVMVLKEAFGSWSCGEWTCLEPTDFLCCTGLAGAMGLSDHKNSVGNNGEKAELVPSSNYLGNLVSHILVLKQLQEQRRVFGTRNWVAVVEDDARFTSADWEKTAETAMGLAEDWDIIKLYEGYMMDWTGKGTANTTKAAQLDNITKLFCGTKCNLLGQCILHVSMTCEIWTTTALLVNLDKVAKIQEGIEKSFKELRMLGEAEIKEWKALSERRFSLDWVLQYAAWKGWIKLVVSVPSAVLADAVFDEQSVISSPP